jgi:hypothetical protein
MTVNQHYCSTCQRYEDLKAEKDNLQHDLNNALQVIQNLQLLTAGHDRLKEVNALLEAALTKLSAEVSAMIGIAELEVRQAVGNTNFNVLELRWNEARAALAAAKEGK